MADQIKVTIIKNEITPELDKLKHNMERIKVKKDLKVSETSLNNLKSLYTKRIFLNGLDSNLSKIKFKVNAVTRLHLVATGVLGNAIGFEQSANSILLNIKRVENRDVIANILEGKNKALIWQLSSYEEALIETELQLDAIDMLNQELDDDYKIDKPERTKLALFAIPTMSKLQYQQELKQIRKTL